MRIEARGRGQPRVELEVARDASDVEVHRYRQVVKADVAVRSYDATSLRALIVFERDSSASKPPPPWSIVSGRSAAKLKTSSNLRAEAGVGGRDTVSHARGDRS